MSIQKIEGGTITTPKGFLAGATYAGLKTSGAGVLDLGILYSQAPCASAALFTTNQIKSASVLISKRHLAIGPARCVVVNSGCANAVTGEKGLADAAQMTSLAAAKAGLLPQQVVVASTGVIGVPLNMEKIEKGIPALSPSPQGGHDLARAIMTTDTRPKEVAMSLEIDGIPVIVAGVAKGAGMIHPQMATMLCFLTTDAAVEAAFLRYALNEAVDASFNMMTVDGDTSPNDTVVLLANGQAGNRQIERDAADAADFQAALGQVCLHLAQAILRDAEGATRLLQVMVSGAATQTEARLAARTIAASPLVKAAVHGGDPNWGRVVAAVGRSGAQVAPERIDLYLGSLCLLQGGSPTPFSPREAAQLMAQKEVAFHLHLGLGSGEATAWGCDLSEGYVTINSAYTT
ncbi:MAG: bifunctional glutamate N-acetyltransferase/amino-acid acetyltransferase ArgJ [Chloroflexi bacterium]|nr:bifunctional glutamate N-acetyltransferase/amino-acid acetyltransferase ArgJ [Chloroflexota bacterium]